MTKSKSKKSKRVRMATGLLGIMAVFSGVTFDVGKKCGAVERWDVKVLTDDKVENIHFHAKNTTIDSLTKQIETPGTGMKTERIAGIEDQVYRLRNVKILRARGEEDDDIHLVLEDAHHNTMIAEIPYCECKEAKNSGYYEKYRKTRIMFLKHKNDFRNMLWDMTGVAFVDVHHGTPQDGVANNNIELHPLLSLHPSN